MASAGTLSVKIIADLAGWSTNLTKAEKQLVKTANNMESLGKKMTLGVTAPVIALGGLLAKSAAEDAASVQKMSRVMGTATKEMEGFIKGLMKTVPETDDAFREMASGVTVLSRSLGLGSGASVEMSKQVLKLAGDLAAFSHTSVGDAVDTLEKALAGKTRGLVEYGVVIDAAAVKQEAYRLGLVKHGQAVNGAAQAQATLSLIMQKTTAQQGEAARTINDAAKAPERFKQALDNLADSMGTVVLPVASKLMNGITGLAQTIADLPGPAQTAIVAIGGIAAGIGPLIYLAGNLTKAFVVLRGAVAAMSGAGGLAGLAGLLTPGGLILAGLGLVAGAIYYAGKAARDEKQAMADYKEGLEGIGNAALEANRKLVQLDLDNLIRERDKIKGPADKQIADAIAARKAGRGVMQTGVSPETQAQIAEYDRLIGLRKSQLGEIGKLQASRSSTDTGSGNGGGGGGGGGTGTKGKSAFEQFLDRVNTALSINESTLGKSNAAQATLVTSYDDIKARLAAMGDVVSPVRDELEKLAKSIKDAEGFIGAYVDSNNAAFLKATGKTPSVGITGMDASGLGYGGRMKTIGGSTKPLTLPSDEKAAAAALKKATADERAAMAVDLMGQATSRFVNELGGVLAGIGSNSAGGRIGGSLGGDIGGGIGKLVAGSLMKKVGGKLIGSVIGSAIPGVGTIIGGIAGNFIGNGIGKLFGGLFGGNKKKEEEKRRAEQEKLKKEQDAAKALENMANAVNEAVSNVPVGYFLPRNRVANGGGGGGGGSSPVDQTTNPRPGTPAAGPIQYTIAGDIYVTGVTDVPSLVDSIDKEVSKRKTRGGPLLALGGGN